MSEALAHIVDDDTLDMALTEDDGCVAYYEPISLNQSLDPYANCNGVMPGCTVLDEYIGHGGEDCPECSIILDPIHAPTLRQRVVNAWEAFKAVFA